MSATRARPAQAVAQFPKQRAYREKRARIGTSLNGLLAQNLGWGMHDQHQLSVIISPANAA